MAKGTDKRQRRPEPGLRIWISNETMRTLVRASEMLIALLTGAGAGLFAGLL